MTSRSIRLALQLGKAMLLLTTGCIPYIHQTTYHAFSGEPTLAGHADPTRPVIQFGFNREFARKTYPFVQVLGEKGDFAFNISVHGEGARLYRALIVKDLRIIANGNPVFTTRDSAFVKEVVPSAEAARYNKRYVKYYASDYVIALNDTLTNPSLQVEYDLVFQDGRRQRQQLHQVMQLHKRRGFTGY